MLDSIDEESNRITRSNEKGDLTTVQKYSKFWILEYRTLEHIGYDHVLFDTKS
jgi:hypothetical protein